jgi:CRP-like cAMP-binding protein
MSGVAEARRHAGPELLSPELEAALRAHVVRRHLARNEVLFTYGSSPEALFCVERGRIRFSVTAANGREAVLSVLEPGQWFGEVSLFIDAPRVYDARAVVDCELLMVPAQAFHAIVDHRPAFLLEFTRLICRRYRWALEWIDETILEPLPVRLARRLLAAQHAHALSARADGDAALRLSQEDLGHMLGVSRQSINRQLKEWESHRILQLEYGRVTVLDQDALRRLA